MFGISSNHRVQANLRKWVKLDDFGDLDYESHCVGLAPTPKRGFTVRSHTTVLRTTTLGAGARREGGQKTLEEDQQSILPWDWQILRCWDWQILCLWILLGCIFAISKNLKIQTIVCSICVSFFPSVPSPDKWFGWSMYTSLWHR